MSPLVTNRGTYVRDLLNVAGQSFIISGFVLFILVVPLYFIYPPLYTGPEDYATNLLFFSKFGFFWTFAGICPIIVSMALKDINVGDLVFHGSPGSSPGIVVGQLDGVPTGWLEDEQVVTARRYRVYWQDQQNARWYWENSLSRYEETNRSDEQEAPY